MTSPRERALEAALRQLLGAASEPGDPEHDPFWEASAEYAASIDSHHVGTPEIMQRARDSARAAIALPPSPQPDVNADMLAALQYWLGNVDPEGRFAPSWHKEAIRLSRAAIARATGKEG